MMSASVEQSYYPQTCTSDQNLNDQHNGSLFQLCYLAQIHLLSFLLSSENMLTSLLNGLFTHQTPDISS